MSACVLTYLSACARYLQSATKSDAGKYFCFAENIYGQDKAAGELVVRGSCAVCFATFCNKLLVTAKVVIKFKR